MEVAEIVELGNLISKQSATRDSAWDVWTEETNNPEIKIRLTRILFTTESYVPGLTMVDNERWDFVKHILDIFRS